jgi:hypothetical protein
MAQASKTYEVKFIGNTTDLSKSFQKLQRDAGVLGKSVSVSSGVMRTALAAVSVGVVVKGLQSAVMAASNLSESIAKTNTVFGKNAKQIQDWSQTTARSLGVSQQAALEAAGTYGNLFRAFGINEQESAKMSQSLVTLAADLASFNNVPIDDALLALRSGLSGETEPLKRFGIALNEARLKEQALAMGLIKTTKGTLPQAIKTQAAYALIMKDSALAQGDVARTAGGLANQLKFLQAGLQDAKAGFGEVLLPIVLNVVTAFNERLLPAIERVVKVFKFEGAGAGLKAVATEISNVLYNLDGLAGTIKNVITLMIGIKVVIPIVLALRASWIAVSTAIGATATATTIAAGVMKSALASTGIGLLIVGLGLLVQKLIDSRIEATALDKEVTIVVNNGKTQWQRYGKAVYDGVTVKLNAASLAATRLDDVLMKSGIMDVKRKRTGYIPGAKTTTDSVATGSSDSKVDKVSKSVIGLSAAAKLAKEKMAQFGDQLKKANEGLVDAKKRFDDFKDSVSNAISGALNFGSAQEQSLKSIKDAADAQIALTKAQADYDKALKTDNIEAQQTALENLQAAQTEATNSITQKKSFIQVLQDQANLASSFAGKVQTLISMGLQPSAITQVLSAGAEAGSQIADEIISGGSTIVNKVNELTASVESVAKMVADESAKTFYQSGKDSAQAYIDGLKATMAAAGFTLTPNGDIINQRAIDQVNKAIQNAKGKKSKGGKNITVSERQAITDLAASLGVEVPAFAKGGIVTKPTLALIGDAGPEAVVPLNGRNAGMGNTINLTVNAGMGADGNQIGREIVDIIKRYERVSGPVFASA